jgi:GT2 family glycosyltransferase/O-antigen/teichoic acid export membrane protein
MAFERYRPSTLSEDRCCSQWQSPNAMEIGTSVSVVICTYTFDRLSDVLDAIRSIERQDAPPYEIIVVVDHNPPLLTAIQDAVEGEIVLVQNRFDRGLSGARNTGIAQATGELVVFLDDDAVADPECLRRLSERCVEPQVIGAGALIEPVWPGAPPSWLPPEFLWVVGCSYAGQEPGSTRNLLGAVMCIRRDVFVRVGGFNGALGRRDANLPFGCEETELCIRATRAIAGSCFIFEPSARAVHRVSPDRVLWSYFAKRCYAEGLSKAYLTQLVGADRSLANEGKYVRQTLARAIVRNVEDVFLRGEASGLARVAAIFTGLSCTVAGFVLGCLRAYRQSAVSWAASASEQLGVKPSSAQVGRRRSADSRDGSTLWNKIQTTLRPHLSLFSNAGLLGLGTGVASVLGFFYWWFAARTFPAAAVGYAAAAISLMNFIGHVGETGMGALLIGDVHRFKERSSALISGALVVSAGCSALFGLGYIAISAIFPVQLGDIAKGWGSVVLVLGCAFTGLTIVLDQALVGLLQSQLQLLRNVSFSVIKLALLIALPFWVATSGLHETGILNTWILGQIASMVLLAATSRRRMSALVSRPDVGLLKPLIGNVLGHHALSLANLAPSLLMPFVVTIVLAPAINAAFYAAWTVLSVAYLVPASLSTVVFAVGARDPVGLSAKLRVSLGSSLAIGLCVAATCFFASNFILALFSPLYADLAGRSFSILGLSIFPITIKFHYLSIQRLRGRMLSASLLVWLGCVFELAGAVVGGANNGLFGLSVGWLIGLCCEALLMTPVVLGSLLPTMGTSGPSPAATPSTLALIPFGVAPGDTED